MTSPINLTVKDRFQEEKELLGAHRNFTENDKLQACFDYAMLSFVDRICKAPLNESGASHFKILGAREFLEEFRKLSAMDTTPKLVDQLNLNHKA